MLSVRFHMQNHFILKTRGTDRNFRHEVSYFSKKEIGHCTSEEIFFSGASGLSFV